MILLEHYTIIRFLTIYLWKLYGHLIYCSHGFVYIIYILIPMYRYMVNVGYLITFMFR